jgi:hypothetical protein
MVSLMAVALVLPILPTVLYIMRGPDLLEFSSAVSGLSHSITIVLLVLYFTYTVFSFQSPANLFKLEEGENEDQVLDFNSSGAIFLLTTPLLMVTSESLVASIDRIDFPKRYRSIFQHFGDFSPLCSPLCHQSCRSEGKD